MRTEMIRTERLILRQIQRNDARALHENCSSDGNTVRFLTRSAASDPAQTEKLVGEWEALYETEDFFLWAIEFEEQVIGTVNLHDVRRETGDCGIGFSIGSRWWNRGIMTEAASAVIRHAFEQLGFKRVAGWCAAENEGSARVMQKIGMRMESCTQRSVRLSDGRLADQIWYSIQKDDKGALK